MKIHPWKLGFRKSNWNKGERRWSDIMSTYCSCKRQTRRDPLTKRISTKIIMDNKSLSEM